MPDHQPIEQTQWYQDHARRAQAIGGIPPEGWLERIPQGSTIAKVEVFRLANPRPADWPDDEPWLLKSRRALVVIGERLEHRLAPIRAMRFARGGFILEIDAPLDVAGAERLGAQIAEIVGEPIPGFPEPLAVHTGFTLRRVAAADALEVLCEADGALYEARLFRRPWVVGTSSYRDGVWVQGGTDLPPDDDAAGPDLTR